MPDVDVCQGRDTETVTSAGLGRDIKICKVDSTTC